MTEEEQRNKVVEAAFGWVRTPFHDCANLKGVGVDCANLLAQVYEEAGIVEHVNIEPYSPQWFLHRSEELFIKYVVDAGGVEIIESEAKKGDTVLYKTGRCFSHGGIVVEWPKVIIHAFKPVGVVVVGGGLEGKFDNTPRKFFTMWPKAVI